MKVIEKNVFYKIAIVFMALNILSNFIYYLIVHVSLNRGNLEISPDWYKDIFTFIIPMLTLVLFVLAKKNIKFLFLLYIQVAINIYNFVRERPIYYGFVNVYNIIKHYSQVLLMTEHTMLFVMLLNMLGILSIIIYYVTYIIFGLTISNKIKTNLPSAIVFFISPVISIFFILLTSNIDINNIAREYIFNYLISWFRSISFVFLCLSFSKGKKKRDNLLDEADING